MFDPDFFPTPLPVISKMIAGLPLNKMTVLEPSAGKGDILDCILSRCWNGYSNESKNKLLNNLYAIEQHPELQSVLRGKGYKVIHGDFLTYAPEQRFDLIVMNPPFSQGAKHLLHALDIADGAQVVCLLNKATLDNDYTKERQLLQDILERQQATITNLGACFSDAERKTNVEVAMVRVPAKERKRLFDFQGSTTGEKSYTIQDIQNNQLAPADVFESLVHRYNKLKSIGHQMFQLITEARFYADGLIDKNPFDLLIEAHSKTSDPERGFNQYIESLRGDAWRGVYNQTKISGLVTTKVRNDIEESQKQHGAMAFTVDNLDNLIQTLFLSLGSIRKDCIVNAFDILTKYHKDNCEHVEGWKTNDAWMIKPKIIVPYGQGWTFDSAPSIECRKADEFRDIEKALCFVTNKQFEAVKANTISEITYTKRQAKELEYGVWYPSEFFDFKFFKKGTIHLRFRDKDVCTRFNVEACQGKNWLPTDYGRSYQ